MATGSIRVQTENIFPVIKKFLYSDHEIFIRELVSNAVDATKKLKTLAGVGEFNGPVDDLKIEVVLDAKKKTISIIDQGIGMTEEEVDKYLNQVAFSSAEEFLEKYKGQSEANVIGHFGLGFYSSFMVGERVEVITKSYKDTPAVRWECDGSPNYTLEETNERVERGTEIRMHVAPDSEEFLDKWRLQGILEKFCKFLPVPIYLVDVNEEKEELKDGEAPLEIKPINNTAPAWIKKPSELSKEDYENFYKELYPMSETPLFWIHLNVDYPFNLTGILYFPKIKHSYEVQKDKISLYSNQVFVTDEVKDIVPEFLMLLHGVIDSPDIPLNVSRSYLQGDPNVKKINNHITKKVADKLDEIFRNDRADFESKWESLGLFVKYGMMTDDKFYDKAKSFLLFEEAGNKKFFTLEEYKTSVASLQVNKDKKTVVLYTSDEVQQDAYIQAAKAKGYLVVKLNDLIDTSWVGQIEYKLDNVQFVRVDSDIADNLIDKSETDNTVLSETEKTTLNDLFKGMITKEGYKVEVKGLSPEAAPIIATRPEWSRRMKDMASLGGGNPMMSFYANMPEEVNFTVNGNHPIHQQILHEGNEAKQQNIAKNLVDLALLSQGLLKGNELTEFVKRSVEVMGTKN
ncbi:molecular chaperone HtpG [Polluticaenibacter yanchengensis]|uniref:Molecular chaperone HtpG n=1 Tax=Polluticaenibacter yanchengensis TaxID=3014562 RepID=A0ABT4UJP7_9BACT|nr:molecular chaperone HtpG [Chitinophagaceae bacterium LY-5]